MRIHSGRYHVAPVDEPGVQLTEITVETRNGPRGVLTVLPTAPVVIGAERLAQLREGRTQSPLDDLIIARCRESEGIRAVVFQAATDGGEQRWSFGEDLGKGEDVELARLLLHTHILLFREVEPSGVCLLFGVGFGARERRAYERAADELSDSLSGQIQRLEPREAAGLRLEHWLIDRQARWSGVSLEACIDKHLPTSLVAAERQHSLYRRMVERGSSLTGTEFKAVE